ncbi:MAG: hypothetical protein WC522_00330 [Candidatus Omnitrophota bacterium]
MNKNIAVIIPALDRNRYHEEGDLVRFGDLTLLEWKFIQLEKFTDKKNIYVSTPSRKVEKVVKESGINVIRRKKGIDLATTVYDSVKAASGEIIMWTHATSPFVSHKDFDNMFNKFMRLPKKYDSLISVYRLQEMIIYKNEPLNFDTVKECWRSGIEPVYRITNGCSIARRDTCLKYKNHFGMSPFLFEIDILSSMEIKDVEDLPIANEMISLFIKKEIGASARSRG